MSVPLCKDCKWLSTTKLCAERDNVDLVSGKPIPQDPYNMRNRDSGRCGWDAKLFVAKP